MRRFSTILIALALSASPGVAAPVIFSDAGPRAADIQDTVDAFRAEFSALNTNTPTNEDPDGRREINWDGVPDSLSDPNDFPGDFFNGSTPGRARGIEFVATGDTEGFEVSSSSASGVPILFDEPDEYSFFSPEKIFRPDDGATFDILFFDPTDQKTAATTRGFGAVFTGLELIDQVILSFYDIKGDLLAKEGVLPSGLTNLSFLGVVFDDPLVARVSVGTGLAYVEDEPVMDDFLYGEPVPVSPVPLPAGLLLGLTSMAALAGVRRQRPAR
ncbi:hypothetical protein AB1M95_02595 [Sulfitobacter sp. LCG007]